MSPTQQLLAHPEVPACQQAQATLLTAVALHVPEPALCQPHYLGTGHGNTVSTYNLQRGIPQPSVYLSYRGGYHNQEVIYLIEGHNTTIRLSIRQRGYASL